MAALLFAIVGFRRARGQFTFDLATEDTEFTEGVKKMFQRLQTLCVPGNLCGCWAALAKELVDLFDEPVQ